MTVRRGTIATVLFAIGSGWTGGNVGPVTSELAREFDVGLSAVGLLSGTVFFGAIVISTLAAAPLARRYGVIGCVRASCVAIAVGNAIFAASPAFGGLVAGRVLVGLGAGASFVVGPVLARALGGVRLLGLFGGGVSLGIALALLLGSVLQDAGVDWRVGFVVSAAVGLAALPFLPRRIEAGAPEQRGGRAFVTRALRHGSTWRLLALFIGANGVPLVVSAWLIEYLTDGGIRAWVAGVLGFVVFGITTIARPAGGRLAAHGTSTVVLAGLSPLLAAAGLAGIALDTSIEVAIPCIIVMGLGFALPYAVMVDAAQRLFPGHAAGLLAILQTGPNVAPMIMVPIVGVALDEHGGDVAFLALAAFVVLAGLLSLRPYKPATD